MNQQEIIEFNRKCAIFVGYHYRYEVNYEGWYNEKGIINRIGDTDVLRFHKDWNWIMEVVDKIESLGFRFEIFSQKSNVKEGYFFCCVEFGDTNYSASNIEVEKTDLKNAKKEAIIEAINQFLTWYNANK